MFIHGLHAVCSSRFRDLPRLHVCSSTRIAGLLRTVWFITFTLVHSSTTVYVADCAVAHVGLRFARVTFRLHARLDSRTVGHVPRFTLHPILVCTPRTPRRTLHGCTVVCTACSSHRTVVCHVYTHGWFWLVWVTVYVGLFGCWFASVPRALHLHPTRMGLRYARVAGLPRFTAAALYARLVYAPRAAAPRITPGFPRLFTLRSWFTVCCNVWLHATRARLRTPQLHYSLRLPVGLHPGWLVHCTLVAHAAPRFALRISPHTPHAHTARFTFTHARALTVATLVYCPSYAVPFWFLVTFTLFLFWFGYTRLLHLRCLRCVYV